MYSRPVCSLRPAKATPPPLVHTSGPTTAYSFKADEEQGARRTQPIYPTPSAPSMLTSPAGNGCFLHPGGQHGGGTPETRRGCDRAGAEERRVPEPPRLREGSEEQMRWDRENALQTTGESGVTWPFGPPGPPTAGWGAVLAKVRVPRVQQLILS